MNKKKLYIMLLALTTQLFYAQQKTDSINKRLSKFSVLTINYFNYGDSDINTKVGKGKIKMDEWSAEFQFAAPIIEKKLYLFNNLRYTNFTYDAVFDSADLNTTKNFHAIAYTAGFIKVLPKRWKLIFNFTPTIASDFKESLSSDDILIQASTLVTKRSSPYFEYGFGLAYTNSLGNPTAVPVINMTYKKNKWKTLIALPAYLSQYYMFNENTQLGLKFAIYGNLYNSEALNSFSSSYELNRVSYSRINIGPDFQTKLFKDFYLHIGTGIALRNILEFQDNDLNTELDFNVDNKFYFNVGIKLLK